MEHIVWQDRPSLRSPVLVAAFDGWNDAGEGATSAVHHLAELWDAERFAWIDPEEFHDFTEVRPTIHLVDGLTREIEWPEHSFSFARLPDATRDVALLVAVEPNLRWRTYCDIVVEVARRLGCELVITLGSLLADTPHTRPVRITGTVGTAELAQRLGLAQSRYEGDTGIVGVLHHALGRAGIASASLWAAVPHYVGRSPSPAAALALLERTLPLMGVTADLASLRDDAVRYLAEIDDAVLEDDEARAYVRSLEEHLDEEGEESDDLEVELVGDEIPELSVLDESVELRGLDELTAEVERFLRDHGDTA